MMTHNDVMPAKTLRVIHYSSMSPPGHGSMLCRGLTLEHPYSFIFLWAWFSARGTMVKVGETIGGGAWQVQVVEVGLWRVYIRSSTSLCLLSVLI